MTSDSIFLQEAYQQILSNNNFNRSINYLKNKKKILLIPTSNRWNKSDDVPKSTRLAQLYQQHLPGISTVLDASKLIIHDCEGNVSSSIKGNYCGIKDSLLKDKNKNPSGYHRCWCSLNNKDDELWKVSKALLDDCDAVVFFGSIRWGQANAVYQRLIERLTWLENRHTTYNESNILKDIDAGVVFTGHNWNGKQVVKTQKQVLAYFGFNIPDEISWNWQYTQDSLDETQSGYKKDAEEFKDRFTE